MQKSGYFMINSSYLHPGDPNSMRNFGKPRNVEYNLQYGFDNDLESEEDLRQKNESVFSYEYKAVRPNDYTKNISEAIFSPGVTFKFKENDQTYPLTAEKMKNFEKTLSDAKS